MTHKASKIKVEQYNPFKNDTLNRKPYVENLSILLENISSPIVLSVNAPWGQGKTTFLEMLNAQLKNRNHKSIYFSAWETDFASDPLQAFLGEINEQIESLINGDTKKSEAWEKTKKAGAHIVKKAIPAIVKAGTNGAIELDKASEAIASKLTEDLTKDFLEEYTKNKEAISEFKAGIAQVLNNENKENTRLFIFIDELDRCRPTYAIELLERIKHLLDIDGLVFVLAMDRVQLSHSVKSIYGSEFEAIGYLRRFIDIEYALPEAEIDAFIDQLHDNFGFNDFFEKRRRYSGFEADKKRVDETVKFLANHNNLSLREIEYLFAKINLVIQSTEENEYFHPTLLVFLIFAKEYHSGSYTNYMSKTGTPESLIKILYSMMPEPERLKSERCYLIEGYLILAKKLEFKIGDTLKHHEEIVKNATAPLRKLEYSNQVINIVHGYNGSDSVIRLDLVKQRIDMLERFKFS